MRGEFSVYKIIGFLEHDDLLPAILFRSSRRQCDVDVERLARSERCIMPSYEQRKITEEVDSIIQKYSMEKEVIYDHPHFSALVETGVGAHHAGQLLVWRLLLEELMTSGVLRMMIATGTVAAGVDFPARTVVITAHSRRGSGGFHALSASELQQMSGRAGRRGKDTVGLCLVAPSMYCDARVIATVSKQPAEPLQSAYFASPSTVLNLLKYRTVDDLRFIVSKSLGSFHDRNQAEALRRQAEEEQRLIEEAPQGDQSKKAQKRVRRQFRLADELEQRQISQLEGTLEAIGKLGHLDGAGLSEKGVWAAELCTTLVLELAEAIEGEVFWDLSLEELVGIVASISGDAHRRYFSLKKNPIDPKRFEMFRAAIARVAACYAHVNDFEVKVLPDAAVSVLTWMEAESWGEFSALLRLSGVAEGDMSRLVTQTADHLNQLSRLRESHPDLARLAFEGRKLILKPPIVDDYALEDKGD